ncbi:hypothetical protein [Paenibacillus sp. NPDC057934]|uniref:hypothetical protein n=1 Tax=Paenibacillus sp. NPDC057934 TaxID=3346282 RepID=UPI0036D983C9
MAGKKLTVAKKAALDTEKTEVVEVPEVYKKPKQAIESVKAEDIEGDVVEEFTQQLSIFGQLIYNASNEDVTLIVDNLGFGDIYVSDKNDVRVGNESQRLLYKEQRAFKAQQLFLISASQPVASIIEIK